MAITNYTELQAAVASWVDLTNLTTTIPDFIALAEAMFNRDLRVPQMEQRDTASISSEYSALPSDFLEAKSLWANNGSSAWELEPLSSESMAREAAAVYGTTGAPKFWARVGPEVRYFLAPDQAYTVELTYWQKVPALASNSTNWLLSLSPNAYLYGSLLQAAPFIRDAEMLGVWRDGYASAISGLNSLERVRPGRLRVDPALRRSTSFNIQTGV